MSIISVIITLIIVGFVLWVVNTFIPMAASIKTILNVLVVILVLIWLLEIFGIINIGFLHLK